MYINSVFTIELGDPSILDRPNCGVCSKNSAGRFKRTLPATRFAARVPGKDRKICDYVYYTRMRDT